MAELQLKIDRIDCFSICVFEGATMSFKVTCNLRFCNSKDEWTIDRCNKFQNAFASAEIYGLVWHDLRATFGTRLGEAGFVAFTIRGAYGS